MKQVELNNRKVAVIGCGFVGATSAFGLMQSGLFSEMVLIDANTEKAEGEAMDISHGIPFARPMKIYSPFTKNLKLQSSSCGSGKFGRRTAPDHDSIPDRRTACCGILFPQKIYFK